MKQNNLFMISTFQIHNTHLEYNLFLTAESMQKSTPIFLKDIISKDHFFVEIRHLRALSKNDLRHLYSHGVFFVGQLKTMSEVERKKYWDKPDIVALIYRLSLPIDVKIISLFEEYIHAYRKLSISDMFTKDEIVYLQEEIWPYLDILFEYKKDMTFEDKKYRPLLRYVPRVHDDSFHDPKVQIWQYKPEGIYLEYRRLHLLKLFYWIDQEIKKVEENKRKQN